MKLTSNIRELLYPSRCPVCDGVQPVGHIACRSCSSALPLIRGELCRKCGRSMGDLRGEYCRECAEGRHIYREGRVLFGYGGVRKSIYRFKYMGRREYAEFYGRSMALCLGEVIRSWRPDLLVPVPIHRSRERKRGYNQAHLIASVLGRELGIPVDGELVARIRSTRAMKELTKRQRENNLKKAFKIQRDVVKLSTIVLVDDIYTTGTTIDTIAQVLLSAGIKEVYFVALATSGV